MAYKILYFLPGGQDSIGVIPGSYKKQSIAIKSLVSWNELVPEPINSCLILGARKYVVILQLRVSISSGCHFIITSSVCLLQYTIKENL